MNQKILSSVLNNLKSISDNIFDERNIKSILIDIRECTYEKNSFLTEICHFVAHPQERNQGLCVEVVNEIYFRFKYGNVPPRPPLPFNYLEINKQEFKILKHLIKTAYSLPQQIFKPINLSVKQASAIFDKSYTEEKKVYVLNNSLNCNQKNQVAHIVQYRMKHIEVISLKGQDFINDFCNAIKKLLTTNKIKDDVIQDLVKNIISRQNEIMLCIFSLLQGVKFKLYDGQLSETGISTDPDNITIAEFSSRFPVVWAKHPIVISVITAAIGEYEYFAKRKEQASHIFEVIRDRENKIVVQSIQLAST